MINIPGKYSKYIRLMIWMFKLVGFLLIICSGTIGGYAYAVKLSDRLTFIKKYMEFIMFVENEIKYNCSDISEILNKFYSNGIFYYYICKCKEYVDSGYIFPDAWEKSFKGISKDIGVLNDQELSIIDFGLGIGNSDTQSQVLHCKYYYETIKTYFNNLLEEKKVKSKLYTVLGTCFAAAIALLFI